MKKVIRALEVATGRPRLRQTAAAKVISGTNVLHIARQVTIVDAITIDTNLEINQETTATIEMPIIVLLHNQLGGMHHQHHTKLQIRRRLVSFAHHNAHMHVQLVQSGMHHAITAVRWATSLDVADRLGLTIKALTCPAAGVEQGHHDSSHGQGQNHRHQY